MDNLVLQDDFTKIAGYATQGLAESSRVMYRSTYRAWSAFCKDEGIEPLDLSLENVKRFLESSRVSKSTRHSRRSHILKVLELLAVNSEWHQKQHILILGFLRIDKTPTDSKRPKRQKRALTDEQLTALLNAAADNPTPQGLRDYAMIRLLICTGLRRSELAALRWEDIDLDKMVVVCAPRQGR